MKHYNKVGFDIKTGEYWDVIQVNFNELPNNTRTPILTYCRQLLKEGYKPNTRLEIYRRVSDETARNNPKPDVLVHSIEEASKYTVKETTEVGPVFVKIDKRYADSSNEHFDKLD